MQTDHAEQPDPSYNFYTDYWFASVGSNRMEEDYFDRVCDFYHTCRCMNCFVDIYQF